METSDDHLLSIPHARAIGMTLVRHDDAGCVVRVPYAEHLVGDPDTGVVHGGVLTALLDNTCGLAVRPAGSGDEPVAMATLDLRIDYLGAAQPHRDIMAEAVCFKRTRHIAFVRATAYQTTADEPIATCVASFMLGTPGLPGGSDLQSRSEIAPTGPAGGSDLQSRSEIAPTGPAGGSDLQSRSEIAPTGPAGGSDLQSRSEDHSGTGDRR